MLGACVLRGGIRTATPPRIDRCGTAREPVSPRRPRPFLYEDLAARVSPGAVPAPGGRARAQRGAALIFYIIMLVVLGILASAMLTLFDEASQLATTVNHQKIAQYMAESGLRYAMSQMKGTGSISQKMGNINAIPTYTVEGDKQFDVRVYTLGVFKSVNASHVPANTAITLEMPSGDPFPESYEVPTFGSSANDLYLVSNQDLDFIQALNNARTIGSTLSADRKRIYVTVQDAIEPDIAGRLYYLACQVITGTQTVYQGGSLTVNGCGSIYPKKYGVITITSHDYLYEERVKNADGTYTFTNLQKPPDAYGNPQTWQSGWTTSAKTPGDNLKNLGNGDFVVLNSLNNMNLFVETTGYSGSGAVKADRDLQSNFYVAEQSRVPKGSLSFDDPHNIVSSDPTKNPITMLDGGGISIGASEYYAFGAIWYSGTKHGVNLYCRDGKCDFGLGVRIFFTVKFNRDEADGFVYALASGAFNTYNDIGGDSAMGELLAFAGDSRVYENSNGTWTEHVDRWVDPDRNGIQPPKIGIEFDTYYNGQNSCLCYRSPAVQDISGITHDTNGTHLGYMFWGSDSQSGCANGFTCKEQSTDGGVTATSAGLLTYDDLIHGKGYNIPGADTFTATSSHQEWWRTDTSTLYGVRIEIHRTLEKIVDPASPYYDKYEYVLRTFVHDCSSPSCEEYVGVDGSLADLEGDFLVDPAAHPFYGPVLEKVYYLTEAEHLNLATILLGYTEATGYYTQVANIRHYQVKFRSGGDEAIVDLP